MLDKLRRNASSWMIKTVFSLIIISFMFFFGYNKLAKNIQDTRHYIAMVGDKGITRQRYETAVDSSLSQMKDSFKGELPPQFQNYLKQNVLDQLILREVMAQFGESLGLRVSDEEVAELIRSDKTLFGRGADDRFDLDAYEDKFLPYYRQSTGEDFEEVMKRQALLEKLQALEPVLFQPWKDELDGSAPLPPDPPSLKKKLEASDLLSVWVGGFREKKKIETFE